MPKTPTSVKVVEFDFERETKNTYRFQESGLKEDERGIIGTLYILKAAFDEQPKGIKVTVEVVD